MNPIGQSSGIPDRKEIMKIFTMGASLRKESFNKKLSYCASELLKRMDGIEVDAALFNEFSMPVYDGDLEEMNGIPEGARKLIERVRAVDALVISTPEYNGGIPGALKNAIDWVSRDTPNAFEDKPLLLIGASPGGLGAVRSLWHTRVPLEAVGAMVYPEMFGLSKAHQAFDGAGNFIDPKNVTRLDELLQAFVAFSKKLSGKV